MLSVAEFRRIDANAAAIVPVARMMQRAGRALADAVPEGTVMVLCGKGNNGGDGIVAAHELRRRGRDVRLVLLDEPSPVARPWLGEHERWPVRVQADVLVDCLLGSGIKGRPRAPYAEAIKRINRAKAFTVSCDVPSGLGTPLQVRPDLTVTFHAKKEGMEGASGRIEVVPIGIPKRALTHVGPGDLSAGYIVPGQKTHKGNNGRVLVVGGGPYTGAPHYSGMGALRTGADLVVVATPADAARVVANWGPELIVRATNDGGVLTMDGATKAIGMLDNVGCLLLGPGLGKDSDAAAQAVVQAAAKRKVPIVLDADGLRVAEAAPAGTVLTPHGGEFVPLGGKDTKANVARYAKRTGHIVVKKGATDIIAGHEVRLCDRGHPTMTVGGTGDVLAGCIAALVAKGAAPFEAACAGTYIVGVAGETAAALRSYGATATDVHEAIPRVLLDL